MQLDVTLVAAARKAEVDFLRAEGLHLRPTTLTQEDVSQTFSATPPYEAMRFLVSCVMTPRDRWGEGHVLMFLDITRDGAHQ